METIRKEITRENFIPELTIIMSHLEKCKKYTLEIKESTITRSNDANSFYWNIVSKMASENKISKPYQHNLLLRRYGQCETINGELITVEIPEDEHNENITNENEFIHLKPTSKTITSKNGVLYRTYILLKGSHEYNREEMNKLIDGAISEAKEMGIETLRNQK